MCFVHDTKQPVEEIYVHKCVDYINLDKTQLKDPNRSCDFNLLSGEFAWIDETKQHITGENATPEDSAVRGRRTDAYCREIKSFNQQLNNGRICHSSY